MGNNPSIIEKEKFQRILFSNVINLEEIEIILGEICYSKISNINIVNTILAEDIRKSFKINSKNIQMLLYYVNKEK